MTETIYTCLPYIIIAIFLSIAAIFDLRGGTIPIYLFPSLFGLLIPFVVLSKDGNLLSSFIGLLIGIFSFYILAGFFDGGGGDILMMATLGWGLGARKLVILILVTSGFYLAFSLCVMLIFCARGKSVRDALKKQYPYAPFVLLGYIACVIAGWMI